MPFENLQKTRKNCPKVWKLRNKPYICSPEMEQMWSDGRVARHSSAKAATAVRIRFRPLQKCATSYCGALFLLSVGSSKADRHPRTAPQKIRRATSRRPSPNTPQMWRMLCRILSFNGTPEGLPIFSYTFGNEQVMRIVDNRQHAEWELTNYAKAQPKHNCRVNLLKYSCRFILILTFKRTGS